MKTTGGGFVTSGSPEDRRGQTTDMLERVFVSDTSTSKLARPQGPESGASARLSYLFRPGFEICSSDRHARLPPMQVNGVVAETSSQYLESKPRGSSPPNPHDINAQPSGYTWSPAILYFVIHCVCFELQRCCPLTKSAEATNKPRSSSGIQPLRSQPLRRPLSPSMASSSNQLYISLLVLLLAVLPAVDGTWSDCQEDSCLNGGICELVSASMPPCLRTAAYCRKSTTAVCTVSAAVFKSKALP